MTDDTALAFTGTEALRLAGIAAVLLASGALLTGLARRGRHH
jgi:hypothetical protein